MTYTTLRVLAVLKATVSGATHMKPAEGVAGDFVVIENLDTTDIVYLGPQGANATTDGFPIAPETSRPLPLKVDFNEGLRLIDSGGGAEVRVLVLGNP